MTMKTFFSIIAVLFTAIVTAVFIAGYISKTNRESQAAYVSTIQQEVTTMSATMAQANSEIEKLRLENEALKASAAVKPTGTQTAKKTVTTTPTASTKTTTTVTKPATAAVQAPPQAILTQTVVSKHASESDCWITVSAKVYSVASYISMHPGGRTAIVNQCGKDATTAFTTKGGTGGTHSSSAWSTLGTFFVGSIGSALPM